MEIIFLVWFIFSGNQIRSIQYHNFYIYSEKKELNEEMNCNSYLESKEFKKEIINILSSGEEARVGCVSGTRINDQKTLYEDSKNWKKISYADNSQFIIPKTKEGKDITPNEKPLYSWDVYKEKIVVPISAVSSYKLSSKIPEEAALKFISYGLSGKIPDDVYSKKIKLKFKKEINKNLSKLKKVETIDFYAKLPYKKIGKSSSKGFFTSSEEKKKLKEHIGNFDLVIFLETPPYKEDTFIFLKKENGEYKVVAAAGLLHKE